jgi:predicted  nucleic acid-binding Zn-ribbon protein
LNRTSAIIKKLEFVREKLEQRFLQAGETMASALDGVEALIQSLDQLNHALEGDASAGANKALRDAAADLLALPAVQVERRVAFETLVQQSKKLSSNIEQMNTMLRYLRAFAMNLKVTSASAAEFNGFAQELMERIAIGAQKLALFNAKLKALDEQLGRALGFVCNLEGDCERLLPSVATDLQSSSEAIQEHNDEINVIAAEVAELAKDIRKKVGKALMAMQIGDNTRQRIEHVQAGLGLLQSAHFDEDLGMGDHQSANLVRRVLLEQLIDLEDTFAIEARKVSDNLIGLRGGASEVLRLKTLIGEGRNAGFLRNLEGNVSDAHGVVDRVRLVNGQAGKAGRAVVDAVEALVTDVDAIQSVKTEIRYMAINTSIRCARMGPEGRPVSVVGVELRAGADKLGEAADGTMGDLDGLSEGANAFVAQDVNADLGQNLDQALQSIRQAGDAAETNLEAVGRGSDHVARAMDALSAIENFHDDLRAGLEDARETLAALIDPDADEPENAGPMLDATLSEMFKCYTMDREREIHRRLAPQSNTVATGGPAAEATPANDAAMDDDALFADALF